MFLITEVLSSLLDHGYILSNSCWHFFSKKKKKIKKSFPFAGKNAAWDNFVDNGHSEQWKGKGYL